MAVLGGTPAVLGGTFQATASGAIANGDPVKLNANGTVSKAEGAAGLAMYIADYSVNAIAQYALTSPFDITTATFVQAKSVSAQEETPQGVVFNTDGTRMFVTGNSAVGGSYKTHEYQLTVAFDVSTATFTDSFVGNDSSQRDLTFNQAISGTAAGTYMFIVGAGSDAVWRYALSTPFDISTASYTQQYSVSSQDGVPTGIEFNPAGTKMFVTGYYGDTLEEYALSSAFDLSSVSYTDGISISGISGGASSFRFNSDGTKCFFCDTNNDRIIGLTLSGAYDISTADTSNIEGITLSAYGGNSNISPAGICFGIGVAPSTEYIGIANAAVSDGATATIQIIGSIDDAASSLTPGRLAYISTAGAITSTPTSLVAGVALSATKVLIKGNYSSLFD